MAEKPVPEAGKPTISVVINTLNEEANLPWALASVRWADEIVVVDMNSEDRTREIAREHRARIIDHPPLGFVEPARAAGIEAAGGTWVLILDADEMVPETLAATLLEMSSKDDVDVVEIPRINYMFGAGIRHGGWRGDAARRFFRKGRVTPPARIHGTFEVAEGARCVRLPPAPETSLRHFNYVDLAEFVERLNRYTNVEAEQALGREQPTSALRLLYAPVREFLHQFVGLGGWRDGQRGLHLAVMMAFYRALTHAKMAERVREGDSQRVQSRYEEIKRRLIEGCESQARDHAAG